MEVFKIKTLFENRELFRFIGTCKFFFHLFFRNHEIKHDLAVNHNEKIKRSFVSKLDQYLGSNQLKINYISEYE